MDWGFEFRFDQPWFLLLLLVLPVLWVMSLNSLAGLGHYRRWFALLLRTVVFSLLVLALAQMQWRQKTDRLTVIYLLDQSQSIPAAQREFMLQYAAEEVRVHRRDDKRDMSGVIIFGANAKIESAPYDGNLPTIGRIEGDFDLDVGATSIESALKLAKASFPEDTARRVVVISDGNENIGDAVSIAQTMAEDGIGIDVVPIRLLADADVSVDKIVIPSDLRRGQEFEARVVLTNNTVPSDENPDGTVTGKLLLAPTSNQASLPASEQTVTLRPGKNIFGFTHKIEKAAVFTFEARFVPDDARQDLIDQNNRATAFSHVRGKGKVLLIEDGFNTGEFSNLIDTLQQNAIEVDVIDTRRLFASAAELLQYDSVIMANVARASGNEGDDVIGQVESFSDAQIRMLVENCEHFGCGIVMIGGDRSFGAGGWSNSMLEKAMPVDFQIKNDKVAAVGALALMMHGCEMANANFWQVKIAEEALNVLGPMDYCGVIDWSDMGGQPRWLWKLPNGVDRVFKNRNTMNGMIRRMTTGDMPDFNAPMRVMLAGLNKVDASMKHVIIISDGDPTPPTGPLLQQFVAAKIKISTCAVGTHGPAGSTPLKKIANITGGKYYKVTNNKALPQIFQREARRVAKPVIRESAAGMQAIPTNLSSSHEMLKGINVGSLPPFTGFVLTTLKGNSLVEQLIRSSDPDDDGTNSTLLATWRYGNGRATVFTSDAGSRWTSQWFNDPQYDKLFTQMVRYSMRPITQDANFNVATELKDGVARVVVTALDENDEFLNFLDLQGSAIGPDGRNSDLEFNAVGPGRYVAEQKLDGSGNFLATIFPGEGYQRLTTGVNVPYSSEYSDRESNVSLLESLAQFEPRGGERGEVVDGTLKRSGLDELLAHNSFRPTLTAAISVEDIWPLLVVLCATAFVADIFIRRVQVSFDWIGNLFNRIKQSLGFGKVAEKPVSISRLQSRKAEIEAEIESRRASTRFAPEVTDSSSGRERLDEVIGEEIAKTPAAPAKIKRDEAADEEQTSYTSRLLDAKRKARKDQDRGKE